MRTFVQLRRLMDSNALLAEKIEALKQAVRRNPDRFPADFMFELTPEEARLLVSQTVIPGLGKLGGADPMAFTEQGVAMLSSVSPATAGPPSPARVQISDDLESSGLAAHGTRKFSIITSCPCMPSGLMPSL